MWFGIIVPMYIGIAIAFLFGCLVGWVVSRKRAYASREDMAELGEEGRDAIAARIAFRKRRIMEKALSQGRITNDEVEDMFCISNNTAGNYLQGLEDDGELRQVGKSGRGVYYVPVAD